jgi:hypothetical protein
MFEKLREAKWVAAPSILTLVIASIGAAAWHSNDIAYIASDAVVSLFWWAVFWFLTYGVLRGAAMLAGEKQPI